MATRHGVAAAAVLLLPSLLGSCASSASLARGRGSLLPPTASREERLARCPRLASQPAADTAVYDSASVDDKPVLLVRGHAVYPGEYETRYGQAVRVPVSFVVGVDGMPEPGSLRTPASTPADSGYIRAVRATASTVQYCPGARAGLLVRVRVSTSITIEVSDSRRWLPRR